jgi:uncharacterized protein
VRLNWSDLGAAFALYFVIEGIAPFVSPAGAKRMWLLMVAISDRELRVGGLVSMIMGVAILFAVRS